MRRQAALPEAAEVIGASEKSAGVYLPPDVQTFKTSLRFLRERRQSLYDCNAPSHTPVLQTISPCSINLSLYRNVRAESFSYSEF